MAFILFINILYAALKMLRFYSICLTLADLFGCQIKSNKTIGGLTKRIP